MRAEGRKAEFYTVPNWRDPLNVSFIAGWVKAA